MMEGLAEHRSILRFEQVKLYTEQGGGGETIDFEMNLFGGDLALINLERPRFGSILADACCGLYQAAQGSIFFLGKDWSGLPSDTANALRGRIGRVFTFGNWIDHLTLLENILLPQLHHTRRKFAEIRDEAVHLAEHFGLPGLPTGLPDDVMRTDHQRAACIRAFLGQPILILLEEPTFGVYPEILPPLINAIRKACDRGCGVIWLTLEDRVWNDPMLPATHRYRLTARKLMEVIRVSLTYQQTRFRYANQAVGVFVILTVIVFGAAFLFSGQVRKWLDPGGRIKVILPSGGLFGLSAGADVEILGTKAGKVIRIVISPDQQIHAEVQIQSDMKSFVRRDSTAVIRKKFGVAGDSFLYISRGLGEPLDWEYAVITAVADRAPTESIGEILDEVRTKVFPILDDTRVAIRVFLAVMKELQDPEGHMQQLLAGLNTISEKMSRGEGTIGRLLSEDTMMNEVEALISQLNKNLTRFEPLIDDLEATLGNVSKISAKINKQSKDLPEVTLKLKEVLISAKAVMDDLSRTTPQLPGIAKNMEDATDSMPVLMLQTQQVMAELEQLLKQLQSSWLLGGKAGQKSRVSTRISPLEVRP